MIKYKCILNPLKRNSKPADTINVNKDSYLFLIPYSLFNKE